MPIDSLNSPRATPAGGAQPVRPVESATAVSRQESAANGKELPPAGQQSIRKQDVEKAVSQLNHHVQVVRRDLQFTVDDDTGKTVVKVTDSDSGELIRQIPSEEVIAISQAIAENLEQAEGLILREQV